MGHDRLLEQEQVVAAPLDAAFAFFADPGNLERITPPWLHFRILEAPPEPREGSLFRYRLRLAGVPIGWTTQITAWEPPHRFVDTQLRGPYRLWEHTHELEAVAGGTLIRDRVRYRAPLRAPVEPWLRRIFDFRAAAMRDLH